MGLSAVDTKFFSLSQYYSHLNSTVIHQKFQANKQNFHVSQIT